MEDTLRDINLLPLDYVGIYVLILVLMEDTLRDFKQYAIRLIAAVLILVLMEDTLRVYLVLLLLIVLQFGLNPCFNGRYSQSVRVLTLQQVLRWS